jgi:hypothetical protein
MASYARGDACVHDGAAAYGLLATFLPNRRSNAKFLCIDAHAPTHSIERSQGAHCRVALDSHRVNGHQFFALHPIHRRLTQPLSLDHATDNGANQTASGFAYAPKASGFSRQVAGSRST